MQWLQSTFANRFNRMVRNHGHMFEGRYKALLIEDGGSLLRGQLHSLVLVRDTPFLGSCGYPGVTPAPTAV